MRGCKGDRDQYQYIERDRDGERGTRRRVREKGRERQDGGEGTGNGFLNSALKQEMSLSLIVVFL